MDIRVVIPVHLTALPRIRVSAKACAYCGTAACIGVIAWRGAPALIAIAAIIPVLIFLQRSRVEAFVVALAYYAAANWPLISGTFGYFGSSGTVSHALFFWAVPSLLLPLPWTVCWTSTCP